MKAWSWTAFALLVFSAGLAWPSSQGFESVLTFKEVPEEGGAPKPLGDKARLTVGIGSEVQVIVDHGVLLRRAAARSPRVNGPEAERLINRLGLLKNALETSTELLRTYLADVRPSLEALRERPAAEQGAELVRLVRTKPFLEHARLGNALFGDLLPKLVVDRPALRGELNRALNEDRGPFPNNFDLVGKVLGAELSAAAKELEDRPELRGFSFSLTAIHHGVSGATVLGLPGYTTVEACVPKRYNRFDVLSDERTTREVEAAAELAPLVEKLRKGGLGEQLTKLLAELRGQAAAVRVWLGDQGLNDTLALVESLARGMGKSESAKSLLADIQKIRACLAQFDDLSSAVGKSPDELLLGAAGDVQQLLLGAADLFSALRTRANVALERIQELEPNLDEAGRQAKADLLKLLQQVGRANDSPQVAAFLSDIDNLRKIVAGWRPIEAGGQQLHAQAKKVPLGEVRDTVVRASDLCSKRSDGDLIEVHSALYDQKGELVDEERRWLELEVRGAFGETRGFLAFVDPEGHTDQPFAAAAGLGFFLHYNFGDAPLWDKILRPGLGLTLLALDLERDQSLELGLSLGAVFFRDLVHVGFGRDLQARRNYFYVGLNPLAFSGVFSPLGRPSVGQTVGQ